MAMRPRRTLWVVIGLMLAGTVCVALRWRARQQQLAEGDSLWRITYSVHFQADKPGARVRIALPADTATSKVYRQDVLYTELETERLRPSSSGNRESSLVAAEPGPHHVTVRLAMHVSHQPHWAAAPPALDPKDRARCLKATRSLPIHHERIAETLQELGGPKQADIVRRIYEHAAHDLGHSEDEPDAVIDALERRCASPLGRARTMVALCRAAGVPARVVAGFEIVDAGAPPLRYWAEVFERDHWAAYDPEDEHVGAVPFNYVPVRRDGVEIVRATDSRDVQTELALIRLPPGAGALGTGHRHPIEILDLTRLPLPMHETIALILLLPLGGLVTAVLRTMVGLQTFGTFTPALIALSFVFADWRTGLFLFAFVLTLGITARTFLDRLKLLMVPRLGFVLTLVVLCLVLAVSLFSYLAWTPSPQAVLLPMVIMTMTIERLYLTSEEDGLPFALKLLAGTMALALVCYLILRWKYVGEILVAYPELHLFTLAAMVLIGRYTGYRLSELWRFRDLAEG